MPEWVCPDCGGGFPSPARGPDGLACPWCEGVMRCFEGVEHPDRAADCSDLALSGGGRA